MLKGEGGEQEGQCGGESANGGGGGGGEELERDQEDASGRDGEIPSETLGCKLYGLCGCAMSSYIKFYK